MQKIEILVSGKAFSVDLFDTGSAKALTTLLPMEVTMQELNGNEKYIYLSDSLPVAEKQPEYIHAGDLMLFGSKCLVLFYRDFPTSYRYTPLGRVENIQHLAKILSKGDITVAFQKNAE